MTTEEAMQQAVMKIAQHGIPMEEWAKVLENGIRSNARAMAMLRWAYERGRKRFKRRLRMTRKRRRGWA